MGSFMTPQNVGPGEFLRTLKTSEQFSSVWVGSVKLLEGKFYAALRAAKRFQNAFH